ncbi:MULTISPECIES: OmpA family protein [unclassified Fibrobacter]|uniref:OmpA family protein n=1 Tax=unclassified Fibrobacter TaxID=2634177 RepID=UPI000915ABEE|nr:MULTISPECIES: OmpA family protein [Fibrobacter]MCQ2100017.1 OmpA family protein [Fibrobacter sp.]MCL4102539.1 Peptidoglycan-associated lipoprotein [Fibrobacter succinogenes]MDO4947435.1 OmpA family protein [Fibrobacter sp.]OWV08083.1 hypothetical protein B7993_00125 [Fibrobacter sp. UWH3]OWV13520.1 hypothetical protein B7992_08160 [Fibrobacter sp. UWH1]
MKKALRTAVMALGFAAGAALAQPGIEGGTDGLHQINTKTLGIGNMTLGTGGNISTSAWGLSRGGVFEMDGKRYSYNAADYSQAGNIFFGMGVLDFWDIGVVLPLYYEHANSDGPSGDANQWTTSRGDLDMWMKIRAPFKSKVFSLAAMLDLYAPTGEIGAGVRPRHVWYLNSETYTSPFTAGDWTFAAGLVTTFDFTKVGYPFRVNAAASYVYPVDLAETNALVYAAGVNWIPKKWVDVFLEYSGEMRLQSKGNLKFSPMNDPMLITPGFRFHLPYNVDFAVGLEVAVRTFKNLGFDHDKEIEGCDDVILSYIGENGHTATYCYAPTPLISGAAVLSVRFDPFGPKDTDKDGVPDEQDKCPSTAKGIKVGSDGCPLDSDKDGVIDDLDKCPNTPAGSVVFYDGCIDTTGTRLKAEEDARNKAKADSAVSANARALILDLDGDGILDDKDKCPNTPAGVPVDSTGCPMDFDHDGVNDAQDKCPNTPAGTPVDSVGCPMDFDHDGVPDHLDKCPNTPVGIEVDINGCKMDSDKDGIPDTQDKCPGTPEGMPVDSIGCSLDFDHDGVPDMKDKCPNTLPGIRVDENGCPLDKKEDLDQLKKGIQFKTGSATLTKSSFGTLDDVAALMRKIPNANLEVQGHTDDKGSDEKNMKLSQDRAQAVVDYLIKRGVEKDRLRAVGYGRTMPLADNVNEDGRAQNRRVELVPFEK